MTGAARKSLEPWLRDNIEYYDYQAEDVRTAAFMQSFLLGHQMGLGKSLIATTVFTIDVVMGKGDTLLVVCPVSLRGNWANELEKFTSFPYTRLGEIPDPRHPGFWKSVPPAYRKKQIEEFKAADGPRVLIANYEQIAAHIDDLPRFHMLIVDEAHSIKNPEAKRSKAIMRIKRERTAILTGTPVLNRVDELWTLLHMIDPRRWPDYRRFRNRYCLFGGFEGRQVIGAKNVAELNRYLSTIMLRRLKKDVLKLGEPYIQKVYVDLHPEQRKLYDQVEDELFLPDLNGDPQEIDNALVKFLRLKQIAGSSATVEGQPDHSHKLDRAVDEIIDCIEEGGKPIIFTQFRPIQALIVDRLVARGVKHYAELHGGVPQGQRQHIINEWSAYPGGIPIVCMIQVAGVGLNMVASHDMFFVDKLFVPGLNDQAIDRANRIGQTEPVHVREYIAKGTVEQRIEQILGEKRQTFDDVVEASVAMSKILAILKQQGRS